MLTCCVYTCVCVFVMQGELVLRPADDSDGSQLSVVCRFSDTKSAAQCIILDGSSHCGTISIFKDETGKTAHTVYAESLGLYQTDV